MTAYVILIKERTTDTAEMATYAEKAAAARAGHDLKRLVAYGAIEALEGPSAEGMVVLEFPDMAAAHGWYDSPAYQEAKAHRLKGSQFRVLLVDGA